MVIRQVLPRSRQHEADPSEARQRPSALMAWAGIVGPVLFTAAYLTQEAFRRAEYSPVAETVSALEAGPNGWVQQANFVVFGLLTVAFAVGLNQGVRPCRAGIVGSTFLALSGLALILNGAVFPLREDAAGVTYDPGGHVVFGLTYFLCSGIWPILLSRRMATDPRWRSLAGYALGVGVAMILLFVAIRVVVVPDDAPLHPYAGLAQRAALAVLFPCMVVLGLRLRRVLSLSGR